MNYQEVVEKIIAMWTQDSIINKSSLGDESIRLFNLHAKYLGLIPQYRMQFKLLKHQLESLTRDKKLYYDGRMSATEKKRLGYDLDVVGGLKLLKEDVKNHFIPSDPDIQELEKKIDDLEIILLLLDKIVSMLHYNWQGMIKSAIEWHKTTTGG